MSLFLSLVQIDITYNLKEDFLIEVLKNKMNQILFLDYKFCFYKESHRTTISFLGRARFIENEPDSCIDYSDEKEWIKLEIIKRLDLGEEFQVDVQRMSSL